MKLKGFLILLFAVLLLDLAGGPHWAFASTIAIDAGAIDVNTPVILNRIADGFHVLDNGTVATFFDSLHGVPLAGSITTPYKKYYTSLDLGLAYPLTIKGQNESSTTAEFIGGLRLHAGELAYDKIPQVKSLIDGSPLAAGILQYSAIGVFYSRDWSAGLNRLGPYGGFELHF